MEKETRPDFSKICRTCLLQFKNMRSIFTQNISEMIIFCTNIKIDTRDDLPKQICSKCIKEVKTSYHFKLKSEKSEELLHKYMQDDEKQLNNSSLVSVIKTEDDQSEETAENETIKLTPQNNEDFDDADSLKNSSRETSPDGRCAGPVNEPNASGKLKKEIKRSEATSWKCEICAKELYNKHSVQRHMITHPEYRTDPVQCSVCKKQFFDKQYLTKHMLRHKGEKRYSCEFCDRGFYELTPLANHVKKSHDVKPVQCSVCQKELTLQLQLDLHMRTHRDEYICNVCGKQATSLKALCSHRRMHNTNPFPCTQCDRRFKYKYSLHVHIKSSHMGIKKKKDVCNLCGFEVLNLNNHMLRRHATEKPHKCDRCEQAFAKKWILKQHQKMHTDEPRQQKELCTICGKKLMNYTKLRYHMRIHTGEKPYDCSFCEKAFKTKSAMMVHKRVHTGERRYECTYCQKRFTASRCLKDHILIHTGERPHVCSLCGRAFTQRTALKTHMKIH